MGIITVVGLGPGAVGNLSLETMGLLQSCEQVILRTAVHPTVSELKKQHVKFTSCDDLYEKAASFEEVYNRKSIPLKWLQDNCIKVNDLDILKYIKE